MKKFMCSLLSVFLLLMTADTAFSNVKKYVKVDADTYVAEWEPTVVHGAMDELYAMYPQSGSHTEVFFKAGAFGTNTSCFTADMVVQAKLWVYDKYGDDDLGGEVTMVNTTWGQSTLTWNNKPVTYGSLVYQFSGIGVGAGWKSFDITIAAVSWLGGTTNNGVNIRGTGLWIKTSHWYSSETVVADALSPFGTAAPYIEIEFANQIKVPVDGDAWISQELYSTPGGADDNLWYQNSGDWRVLLRASTLIAQLVGHDFNDVVSASLMVYNRKADPSQGDMFLITSPWDESTVTYLEMPAAEDTWHNPITSGTGWKAIDLNSSENGNTNVIQRWLTGTPNYGIMLRMHPNSTYGANFYSRESTDVSKRPYIVIGLKPNPTCCGQEGTVYLPSDFNKDCKVNFADFAIFTTEWLQNN